MSCSLCSASDKNGVVCANCSSPLDRQSESPKDVIAAALKYWERELLAHRTLVLEEFSKADDALIVDFDLIVDLRRVTDLYSHRFFGKTYSVATFSYPEQSVGRSFVSVEHISVELLLGAGPHSGGPSFVVEGYILEIDRNKKRVTLAWDQKGELEPWGVINDRWLSPRNKLVVVSQLADRVKSANGIQGPLSGILTARSIPRVAAGHEPQEGIFESEDDDVRLGWLSCLENSVIAVQGPPGTGKTHLAARLIREFIRSGRRVGITAQSHEAGRHVVEKLVQILRQQDEIDALFFGYALNHSKGERPILYKHGFGCRTGDKKVLASLDSIGGDFVNVVVGTSWFFSSEEIIGNPVDLLIIEEASQYSLPDAIAVTRAAKNIVMIGDPLQLQNVKKAEHFDAAGRSVMEHVLGGDDIIDSRHGIFLSESHRMAPAICNFVSEAFYESRLMPTSECQNITFSAGEPLWSVQVNHVGRRNESEEEAEAVHKLILRIIGHQWTDRFGVSRPLTPSDIMVIAPYNDQVGIIEDFLAEYESLVGVKVFTVDKAQGKESPVVIYSMTTSTHDDMVRKSEFLFSPQRFNVAVSRAQCLFVLVYSDRILDSRPEDTGDDFLLQPFRSLVERSQRMVL